MPKKEKGTNFILIGICRFSKSSVYDPRLHLETNAEGKGQIEIFGTGGISKTISFLMAQDGGREPLYSVRMSFAA